MIIKFALAVDNDGVFDDRFFGNADKFLVFQENNNKLIQVAELKNELRDFLKNNEIPEIEKVNQMITYLLKNDIKIIVSRKFGEHVKMVNQYFVPVLISSESVDQAIQIINGHLHWIKDEINYSRSGYKLFTISSGIMKSKIEDVAI